MSVLQFGPEAPMWARVGADVLLGLHIGGGSLGIISGTTALLARKGERLHRIAGTVFFLSMLTAYAIGAGVAPFLDDGQRTNFVAGVLALYLLISGWTTVMRRDPAPGTLDAAGLVLALSIVAAGLYFMRLAAQSPTHTIDGSPPQAFYMFVLGGSFAAAGDLNLLLRRGLSGVARISRHLWRMCFSLFIASGSFFLGQQQVMPAWLQGSAWLFLPALAPLAFLLFWLLRVRLAGWSKTAQPAPQ
jgi:hypothetical protein